MHTDTISYISFKEVRQQIGFKVDVARRLFANTVGMGEYFLFCEMVVNIMKDLSGTAHVLISEGVNHQIKDITDTIKAVLERTGFEWRNINDEWMIVEKNAVSLAVADTVEPELADAIIEYNHYLLRGDLIRKQNCLRSLPML